MLEMTIELVNAWAPLIFFAVGVIGTLWYCGRTDLLKLRRSQKEQARHDAARQFMEQGKIKGAQVWIHRKTGNAYNILFLTNMYTDKPSFIVNVVYSKHWAYLYSRPLADFLDKFYHDPSVDNTPATGFDDLMALTHDALGRVVIDKPEPNSIWVRVDHLPDGFKELDGEMTASYRARSVEVTVQEIVNQSPSQPFVLYSVNGERELLNLDRFLRTYKRKELENV